MNWGVEDLVAAVAIIVALLSGIVLTRRTPASEKVRMVMIAAIVLFAVALWAHLAVGLV